MSLRRVQWENGALVTAALVLFAMVLGASREISSRERAVRSANLLPAFRHMDLREIRIARRTGDEAIVLSRDPTDPDVRSFSLSYPGSDGSAHADEAAVARLLSTLEQAPLLRRIAPGAVSEEQLGFDPPELDLSLVMGALQFRLLIGNPAPTPEGARYVRLQTPSQEDVTGVTSAAVTSTLMSDGRSLLGTLLFRYGIHKTQRLVLASAGESVELVRDELGFRLGSGGQRADRSRLDGLFFQMARTSLESFTPPPSPQEFKRGLRIEQTPTQGPTQIVWMAEACPNDPNLAWFYRQEPDPVAGCAPKLLPPRLTRSDLGSRGLAPVRQDEVDHVVIDLGGQQLDLVRQEAGFLQLAPEQKSVALERGRDFLTELLGLRGKPTTLPSGAPAGVLRLSTLPPHAEAAKWLEVELFPSPDQSLVVRRRDDNVVLELPPEGLALLTPSSHWFADRRVLALSRDEISSLSIGGGGLLVETLLKRDNRFVFPDGSAADQELLDGLLGLLESLEVARFAPQEEWLAGPSPLTVELGRSGGQTERLLIGQRTRAGYLARLDSRVESFVLPPESVRILQTSLVNREPARLAPGLLAQVELRAFGATTRLIRNGEDLVLDTVATPGLADALEQALGSLEVLSAIRERRRPPSVGPLELTLTAELLPAAQRVEWSFGEVLAGPDRTRQRLRVSTIPLDFYVDRASVLRLLDLL